jgi:hypothetical protein
MSSGMGGMDIRLPMGLMFLIIGAVIGGYGLMTNGQPMYEEHSLGVNINLIWGGVLAGFGILMLALTFLGAKKNPQS